VADRFVRLIIPRPDIDELFYRLEEGTVAQPGDIVEVDLRSERIWALVRETIATLPSDMGNIVCKPVRRIITATPLFRDRSETAFLQWLADYYLYPFPKLVKQIFGPFISKANQLRRRTAHAPSASTAIEVPLTADQQHVVNSILARWRNGDHRPALLFGVTGSGKSEVYAALCREIFAAGKQVLYLVPEVGLTAGTLRHLEMRLGEPAVLLHSYLPAGRRFSAFSQALEGTTKLIVGTRSALLYPLPDLGLIIVDEEHDPSYKNLEPPYYHARDAAGMKASLTGIPIVLGSATPSTDSWHNALRGKYHLERLPRRANDRPPPPITLFPYRGDTHLPMEVADAVRSAMGRGEQTLFFVNRRGFAPIAVCRSCETVQKCPSCDTALVYHKRRAKLVCHHCGFGVVSSSCPQCHAGLHLEGAGIERIVETLHALFPDARIASVDRDSTPDEGRLSSELQRIESGAYDIIAGTIMVSKGHNFPALTQVVVKHADFLLALADYRAAERCFQIIMQVAGRAARFEKQGAVWAETLRPEHYLWTHLPSYDYEGFLVEELRWRRDLGLPPYTRIAVVKTVAATEETADRVAREIYDELCIALKGERVRLLPPVAPPLQRVRNRHRRHLVVIAPSLRKLAPRLREIMERYGRRRAVTVTCDIDALSTMQI